MDIRNWPMDKIMQLPDACFGRRWMVGLGFTLAGAGAVFDFSEAALPDRCIVHEISLAAESVNSATIHIRLALGDILATSDAEFAAHELLFGGINSRDDHMGEFEVSAGAGQSIIRIREPIAPQGRRLSGRAIRDIGTSVGGTVILVISSIPNEVPDCLF